MLLFSVILFLIAAGFGAVVLFSILQDKPTPKRFVYTHGIIAATALLIVIYYAIDHPTHAPITSLVLFIIAALGGTTLFIRDMIGKPPLKWLALLHPLIALIALLALVIFILSQI